MQHPKPKQFASDVTVGTKSFDAMWAEFAAAKNGGEQPAGSITVQQYCKRFGVKRSAARMRLDTLRSELVQINVGGQPRHVRCYFLKEAR